MELFNKIGNYFSGDSLEKGKQEIQKELNKRRRYREIRVLRRPVSSNINRIVELATHVYLGYFEDDQLIDSLSFDPNEGQGTRDPIEQWNNEFSVVVGDRERLNEYWNSMKEIRRGLDEANYDLMTWNCGHAASHILENCPVLDDDRLGFRNGSAWALAANRAANITNKTSYEIYRDSKQKKNQ